MIKQLKTIALCAGLAFSSAAVADAGTELKSYLSGVQNFTANFKQAVFSTDKQLLQESSGTLAIQRPNKLRWHVTMPDEELLISDGQALWLYSPFLEQVSVFDLEQAISQSPFMLLTSEDEAIWAEYAISQNDQGFRITPKEVTNIAWLQLNLTGKLIDTIVTLDSQGTRTEYQLSNFSSGVMQQQDSFEFKVPEGVDIDDQRQAR